MDEEKEAGAGGERGALGIGKGLFFLVILLSIFDIPF